MKPFKRQPEPKPETPRSYLEEMERFRVVVHMRDGSVEGTLSHLYPDCLVLTHAFYLEQGARTVIDGEAVIERVKVAWIQRIGIPEGA